LSDAKWLLLLIPLLVLGCVSGGSEKITYSDEGVSITYFEPDMSELSSGQPFNVRVQLQNLGEAEATNIKLDFYKFGSFTGVGEEEITSLSKPDPAAQLPGGIGEQTWRLTAPMVTGTNDIVTQELGLIVSYKYSTVARLEIPILPEDTYLQYKQEGKLPTKKEDSSTGPVKLDFDSPENIFTEDGTFTLTLNVENTGKGYITSKDGEKTLVNTLSYAEISFAGFEDFVSVVNTDGDNEADDCDFDWVKGSTEVTITNKQLWSTGKTKLTCEFKIEKKTESYPTFKARVDYTYNVEQTSKITVSGKRLYVDISDISFSSIQQIKELEDVYYVPAETTILSAEVQATEKLETDDGPQYGKVTIRYEGEDLSKPLGGARVSAPGKNYIIPFDISSLKNKDPSLEDKIIYLTAQLDIGAGEELTSVRSSQGIYIDTEGPEIELRGLSKDKEGTLSFTRSTFYLDKADVLTGNYRYLGIEVHVTDKGIGVKPITESPPGIEVQGTGIKYDSGKIYYDVTSLTSGNSITATITTRDKFDTETKESFTLTISDSLTPVIELQSANIPRTGSTRAEVSTETVEGMLLAKTLSVCLTNGGDLCEDDKCETYLAATGSETVTVNEGTADEKDVDRDCYDIATKGDSKAVVTFKPPETPSAAEFTQTYEITARLKGKGISTEVKEYVHVGKAKRGEPCQDADSCRTDLICFEDPASTETPKGICVLDDECYYDGDFDDVGKTTCTADTDIDVTDGEAHVRECALDADDRPYWTAPEDCILGCSRNRCKGHTETHKLYANPDDGDQSIKLDDDLPTGEGDYDGDGTKDNIHYKFEILGGTASLNNDGVSRLTVKITDTKSGNDYEIEGEGAFIVLEKGDTTVPTITFVNDDDVNSDTSDNSGYVEVEVSVAQTMDPKVIYVHGVEGGVDMIEFEGLPVYTQCIILGDDLVHTITLPEGVPGVNTDCKGTGCENPETDGGEIRTRAEVAFLPNKGGEAVICSLYEGQSIEFKPGHPQDKVCAFFYDDITSNNYGSVSVEIEKTYKTEREYIFVDSYRYTATDSALVVDIGDYLPKDVTDYTLTLDPDIKYFTELVYLKDEEKNFLEEFLKDATIEAIDELINYGIDATNIVVPVIGPMATRYIGEIIEEQTGGTSGIVGWFSDKLGDLGGDVIDFLDNYADLDELEKMYRADPSDNPTMGDDEQMYFVSRADYIGSGDEKPPGFYLIELTAGIAGATVTETRLVKESNWDKTHNKVNLELGSESESLSGADESNTYYISDGKTVYDVKTYTSGSSSKGTLNSYTVEGPGEFEISYDYMYYAQSNGGDANIRTYLDGNRIDKFEFKSPFNGIWGTTANTLWGASPRKITVNLDEEKTYTVRFDYTNGDYKVKMKNIKIHDPAIADPLKVYLPDTLKVYITDTDDLKQTNLGCAVLKVIPDD